MPSAEQLRAISQGVWSWSLPPRKVMAVRVRAGTGNQAPDSYTLCTSQGNSASSPSPCLDPPHPSSPILWQDERAVQKDNLVHWDSEASVCLMVHVEGEGQCPASPLGNSWLWALVPSLPLPSSRADGPHPQTHTHTSPHALHVGCWGEYKLDKSPSNSGN